MSWEYFDRRRPFHGFSKLPLTSFEILHNKRNPDLVAPLLKDIYVEANGQSKLLTSFTWRAIPRLIRAPSLGIQKKNKGGGAPNDISYTITQFQVWTRHSPTTKRSFHEEPGSLVLA